MRLQTDALFVVSHLQFTYTHFTISGTSNLQQHLDSRSLDIPRSNMEQLMDKLAAMREKFR
jgi:hypothetical protein